MRMRRRTQTGLRRVFSGILAASLCLGMLAGPVLAVGEDAGGPAAPSQALTGDRPVITLQGNAVTEYGNPTGFFELSIWVQTPESPPSNGADRFRSVSLALKFDTEILTPVDWETGSPAVLDGAAPYSVQLHTKKADAVSSAYAVTDQRGMLLFSANTLLDASFPQAAPVAVLRFRYDPIAHPMSVADGNADKFVLLNTAPWSAQDGSKRSVVWLADDGEAAASAAGQSVWYESGCTQFYWYPAAPKMVNGSPDTVGKVVSALGGDGSLSTASNLLTKGTDVRAELVNGKSYAEKGADTGALSSILFYDWDDTLIGVLIVPKGADAREMVNEYVGETMLYQSSDTDLDLRGNANYASTARADNYRGKYPYAGPQPVGSTDGAVGDGARYPLTNKLDYCFLKVPMEPEYDASGADAPLPTGRWVRRTGEDGAPAVDTEYPYTLGWAVVENGRPEQTWTTLGVGELADYSADGTTGAVSFTVTDGASFQLADFNFSDDDDGDGAADPLTDSVFSVKAVYRPGEDLLSENSVYCMTEYPYYNKYNELSSDNGGAFSVVFSYERSNSLETGLLQGVTRIRSASVRQDTTTDMKEYGQENIKDTTDKSRTTYTRVATDNGEIIDVALTLSARNNMVDYYLVDLYNSNVVAGNQRSLANTLQAEPVPNNYAYIGAANDYETRFGREGFVVQGTLNSLLEKTSKSIMGTDSKNEFSSYVTYATANDINLRSPTGDTFADRSEFVTAGMADLIKGAVQAAYDAHLSGDHQWWDVAHNHAALTWHQLQLYITDSILYPANMSEPPTKTVTWCRLHPDCMDSGSSKPTNWSELLDKALHAPDDLDGMTGPDIDLFYLRADGTGTRYAQVADFKRDMVDAVTNYPGPVSATEPCWDEVQYYIVHSSYPSDLSEAIQHSKAHFWWYNNGTKPTAWSEVIAAANEANTSGRFARLNTVETAYDKLIANGADNADWVKLTENLSKNNLGEPFDSFTDFTAALTSAVARGVEKGAALGALTWGQLQYDVLHSGDPGYSFPVSPDAGQRAEISAYWWHNGGRKVTNLATLLAAAQQANQGNPAALDALTLTELYSYSELYFCKSFRGERYAVEAELNGFKTAVMQLVAEQGTNLQWSEVQYYLIHGAYADAAITEGRKYYWWQGGGDGAELDLAAGSNEDLIVQNFVAAAFQTVRNGNAKAWDRLTADLIETAWLVSADNDSAKFAELPKFSTPSDLEDFKRHMNDLITAATTEDSFSPPALNWYQVQHYLIAKDYVSDPTDAVLDPAVYWWKHKTLDPNAKVDTPLTQLVKDMAAMCYTSDETAFTSGLTLSRVRDELSLCRDDNGGNYNASRLKKEAWPRLIALAQAAYDTSTQTLQLTWYQVQYYLINEQYVTPEAAAEAGKAWVGWAPDWAATVETATAPVALSAASLSAFPEASKTEVCSPVQSVTDPDTGAVTETYTVTTTQTAYDPASGVLSVTMTDQTVTVVSCETDLAVTTTTTISTVVHVIEVNPDTGVSNSTTDVLAPTVSTVVIPKSDASDVETPAEPSAGEPPAQDDAPPQEEDAPATGEGTPPPSLEDEETSSSQDEASPVLPPSEEEDRPIAPSADFAAPHAPKTLSASPGQVYFTGGLFGTHRNIFGLPFYYGYTNGLSSQPFVPAPTYGLFPGGKVTVPQHNPARDGPGLHRPTAPHIIARLRAIGG